MDHATAPVSQNQSTSRWGRSKFGGGTGRLALISIAGGAVFATLIAILYFLFQGDGPNGLLRTLLVGVIMTPPAAVAVYALCVDPLSLEGATRRPEESIETLWYQQAAADAFAAVIGVGGLAAGGFALSGRDMDAATVLTVVVFGATLVFAVSYLVRKQRAA